MKYLFLTLEACNYLWSVVVDFRSYIDKSNVYGFDDVEFIGYVITFTIRHKKYIGEIKENLIA